MNFGTDGLRGRAGVDITPALARSVGNAIVQVLGPEICVAGDTRPSTPELREALIEGIMAAGGEAIDLGVVPTPALSAAIPERAADGGVMITASHNPWMDNGIKALGGDGRKLPSASLRAIEAAIYTPTELDGGSRRTGFGAGQAYVRHLLAALPEGRWLRDALIVLDAAGGAAAEWAVDLLSALGAQVIPLYGARINDGVGANHPERIAAEVRRAGATAGIALDGDGDRGLLIGPAGQIYDGDALLWMLRRPPLVVGTVMSNAGLERALQREGITLVRTAVGDANVAEAMRAKGAAVGGEPSGHTLFSDGLPTADGLLTCLRALAPDPRTLVARAQGWEPDQVVSATVKRNEGTPPISACDAVVAELEASGARVVVRMSGTEPIIRVMVEAPDFALARSGAERIVDILEVR